MVTPPTVNQISGPGGDHFGPVMSADGQYIVYDPDGSIFLYNHQTHTTVTVAEAGNGFSYSGQTISADGRYVVFQGTNGSQSYVYIYNNDPSDVRTISKPPSSPPAARPRFPATAAGSSSSTLATASESTISRAM